MKYTDIKNHDVKPQMSPSARQARSFLDPLEGKTAAFLLDDRPSNLRFAEAILPLLAGDWRGCSLLDIDAFYSSNLDTIAARVPPRVLENCEITVPEPGSDIEASLADLFHGGQDRPLLLDSANSLYQLLSWRNPRSSSRKFTFLISALSDCARANRKPVVASIYKRRQKAHTRASRSLADAFDVLVSVSRKTRGLVFRCERGRAWRDGNFFLALEM
ncbi:MAG: hypothetical protein LYZ66_05540 [Nitrososphaerales archaeon]|nr:hypothetical protein [Nitrososphaerales archaeon]